MSRSITEVTLPARMGRPEAPIRQRRSVNPKPPQHLYGNFATYKAYLYTQRRTEVIYLRITIQEFLKDYSTLPDRHFPQLGLYIWRGDWIFTKNLSHKKSCILSLDRKVPKFGKQSGSGVRIRIRIPDADQILVGGDTWSVHWP